MRVAILAAVLGFGATAANAEIKRPIVWKDRVLDAAPLDGAIALTSVSKKLYINDCKPNGCSVSPGTDNSITNRSSIPETSVVLDAYPYSAAHWDQLVQCVRETFAPFPIEVVTTNPGTEPHFEVMVGGSDTQLHPELSAGGVAPYISCNAQQPNGLSFVFPTTTPDLEYLCGAVVQEAMHVWGLDHELDAKDPMTYLELGSLKRFQNNDADCGEDLGAPRQCRCGGQVGVPGNRYKQNSFRYMINTFGLRSDIAAPTLAITAPRDGAWVKPAFPIRAEMTSPLDTIGAEIKIDATVAGRFEMAPFVINAPTNLAPGAHTITVSASDAGDRTATATVGVNVMSSCANGESCASGTHCLGGLCLPGSDVDGGLGASCTTADECATNSCATTADGGKCTAVCDAGNTCPSGYDCIDGGGQMICWPAEGGGCSTGGSPTWMLGVLGLLLLSLRRRRAVR